MMRAIETFFGIAALVALVACLPGLQERLHANAPTSPPPTCATPIARAPLLCNRVLQDGSAECAICDRDKRACLSSTHVYCATSCDDPACVARPAK